MKKSKLLALLMAIVMIVTVFAACGNGGEAPSEDGVSTTSNNEGEKNEVELSGKNESKSDVFSAVKVGEIDEENGYYYSYTGNGISYRDSEYNYGIMSADGKYDSGLKYTFCQDVDDKYFMVKEEKVSSIDDIEGLNKSGLIDSNGKVLIPFEYAFFDDLSDRYIKVFTATARTETKPDKDAYIYLSNDIFTFGADEDDILYLCTWKVFDLEKGAFVPGVEGKNGYNIDAYGRYITFVDDSITDYKTVNENGVEAVEGASFVGREGWYVLSDENYAKTVYDSDGNAVFSATELGYSINGTEGDYFTASNYDNGTYVLIDKTGKVVSAEFSEYISDVFGSVIYSGKKLYNFDGTAFIEGTFEYVTIDDSTGKYLCLQNGDQYTLAGLDGTVYETFTKSDEIRISSFVVNKKSGTDDYSYSMKDKDFTIKGYVAGEWMVNSDSAEDEYLYDLVEVFTGATILSGYKDYRTKEAEDGTVYVYAQQPGPVSSRTYDVYAIEVK